MVSWLPGVEQLRPCHVIGCCVRWHQTDQGTVACEQGQLVHLHVATLPARHPGWLSSRGDCSRDTCKLLHLQPLHPSQPTRACRQWQPQARHHPSAISSSMAHCPLQPPQTAPHFATALCTHVAEPAPGEQRPPADPQGPSQWHLRHRPAQLSPPHVPPASATVPALLPAPCSGSLAGGLAHRTYWRADDPLQGPCGLVAAR